MFEPSFKRHQTASLAAVSLLFIYFLIGAASMTRQSITYDEPAHWRYGLQVLHGDTRRFDDSKMPVTALNALPLLTAQKILPDVPKSGLLILSLSRIPTLLAACFLGWLVFAWTRSIFDAGSGLIALGFFVLDPNLQAHAQWITTDIYAALGITVGLYVFWKYMERPNVAGAIFAGGVLGLAQLTKFTCVYLYLLLPLIAMIYVLVNPREGRSDQPEKRFGGTSKLLAHALLILTVSLVVLALGYLGNGWGTPLIGYSFKSSLFQFLQDHSGPLSRLPLPLPRPFVEGLDWVRYYEQTNEGRGPSYLWGQTLQGAFPNYYAWTVFFKVPAAIQILFLWTGARCIAHREPRQRLSRHALFLILPVIFFAVYFNYFCKAQMGIRMILPIFPLMYIFTGSLFSGLLSGPNRLKMAGGVAALGIWAAISVFTQYPHALSYFNELAGAPAGHYRILADSNIEWGQNGFFIRDYLMRNPGTQLDPGSPRPGRVAISANFLAGIVRPEKYAWAQWISQNKQPVATIANGAYLIYDLSPDDISASLNIPFSSTARHS